MATNLLNLSSPDTVNLDPDCAPLRDKAVANQILENAKALSKDRSANRVVSPRLRVELHKNVLASMPSVMPLGFSNRNRGRDTREKGIDLTPFVVSVETSKSINASALGTCQITLKDHTFESSEDGFSGTNTQNTLDPDKQRYEWLDEVEDNDIIVVYLDAGFGQVNVANANLGGDNAVLMDFTGNEEKSKMVSRYSVLSAGAGRGRAVLSFFGYVDSVQKVRRATGTGGAAVTYTITCSDFSKAFESFVKFLAVEEVGNELEQRVRDTLNIQQAANGGVDISPEMAASAISYILLGGRTLDQRNLEELKEKVREELREPVVSTPSAIEGPTAVSTEEPDGSVYDVATQMVALISKVSGVTGSLSDALKLAPRQFLLPKSLTASQSVFDNEDLVRSNPEVQLFHEIGGVQLIELMQILTGFASYGYTVKGNEFAAYLDGRTSKAVLAGQYGSSPSVVGIITGALRGLFSPNNVEFKSIYSMLTESVSAIPNEVEFFLDLKDYHGISDTPITLPTIVCNTYNRPLELLSVSERDGYFRSLQGNGTEKDDALTEAYGVSGLSFSNTPINFIMDTDIISESIMKDGSQRQTMAGLSLGTRGTDNPANVVAVFNKTDRAGASLASPLYHNKQAELAHGFVPQYDINSDIVDRSHLRAGEGASNFANVLFVSSRDKVLTAPIELKGTILSSMLLPSARVGERIAVYRSDRDVPSFSVFKDTYEKNIIVGGVNQRFADDYSIFPPTAATQGEIVDSFILRLQNRSSETGPPRTLMEEAAQIASEAVTSDLGYHSFHGAFRAWFFAHFDCYVIDEVSHGVDINPQDGSIEASTSLTVSYGAMGREMPKSAAEVIANVNTLPEDVAAAQTVASLMQKPEFRELLNTKLRGAGEQTEFVPSAEFLAAEQQREQLTAKRRERLNVAKSIGLASDDASEEIIWRGIGRNYRKIERYATAYVLSKSLARHFTINIAANTVVATPQLQADLDSIPVEPAVEVRFPDRFLKVAYLVQMEMILYLEAQSGSTEQTHQDPFTGLQATFAYPTGLVSSTGLKVAIEAAVGQATVRIQQHVAEAHQIREEFHNNISSRTP